jgi:hypothetical protein
LSLTSSPSSSPAGQHDVNQLVELMREFYPIDKGRLAEARVAASVVRLLADDSLGRSG